MTGEVIAGRYELEERVGSGGMSTVYRAHDSLLERKVALKILHQRFGDDEEYVERFRREARAVAQLAHPNIVTVIDRGEDAGRQYIVFEYVEGDDLKQLIDKAGPLPIDQVVELGREIAAALAFAHERGIVHRDVKPQNVLLSEGRAKVTDFGIARSLDVEHGVTQTGTVLGTSNYIAPEQASGQPIDDRSDVYSFGVVLFELLTGTVPFEGESFVAVALQHINEPAPSVLERRPDTPPRLARLVDAMLVKDHDARPSMDEVHGELDAVDRPETGDRTVVVPPPRRAPRRERRRSRWPLVLAVLGVLLLAGAAAGLLLPDDDNGTPPRRARSPSRPSAPRIPQVTASTTVRSGTRSTRTARPTGRPRATASRTGASARRAWGSASPRTGRRAPSSSRARRPGSRRRFGAAIRWSLPRARPGRARRSRCRRTSIRPSWCSGSRIAATTRRFASTRSEPANCATIRPWSGRSRPCSSPISSARPPSARPTPSRCGCCSTGSSPRWPKRSSGSAAPSRSSRATP